MTLLLILALIVTIAWGVEAFSSDAVANKIARFAKFGAGLVFCIVSVLP